MEAKEGTYMLVGGGPTPNCSKPNTLADIQEHRLSAILRFLVPPSLPPGITFPQPGLPSLSLEMTLLWVT